ncbi:MAG: hypothetical protein CMJ78_01780 [Planctomycetaceae bacterium]|nr:hypothetical protein [Planctomycetaceae bacterium]
MSSLISRRTLLRGVGAAVSLPMLDIMAPAICSAANTAKQITRVGYLYFPNGSADGSWQPRRVDKDNQLIELNEWMNPLEPLKEHLIIPQNVWTPRGNGHKAATATWLTGSGYDDRRIDAGGISVDQLAAKQIGGQTLLPSLELSMRGEGFFSKSLARNSISWSSNNTPVPREVEPRIVFDRMFRTKTGDLSDKLVLDQVLEDARDLRRRGSIADRRKLDEYLESLRCIERRLKFADQQAVRAKGNEALAKSLIRPQPGIPDDHGEYMRLMFDLIVMAYWADATRICTFMLDHGQSNRYFNFINGVQGTWHALSHWKDASGETEDDDGKTSWSSVQEKRDMYNMVTRWHHEQVAYFLARLKAIDEAGESLLNRSIILYGSNLADGHEHAAKNLPLIIAGGGNGTLNTGRHLPFRRAESMSNLHVSMLQAVGASVKRFGDSKEPMTELSG